MPLLVLTLLLARLHIV